jgi:hypothetical protein
VKVPIVWPVSLRLRGEQAAVSSPASVARSGRRRCVTPGLPALRGPRGCKVAKKSAPAQHASVVTGLWVPAVARWSAVNGSGQANGPPSQWGARSGVRCHHHEALGLL